MLDQAQGIPARERRDLDPPIVSVDVALTLTRLREEAAFRSDGRNAETIVSDGPARIIVGVVEASREVGADVSDGHVSLLLLEGQGTLVRGEVRTRVGAGSLAVMAPGSGWSFEAAEPSAFVASFWQPA